MKKIILLFALAFSLLSNAQQSKDSLDIKITVDGVVPLVVQADSLTAKQLYDKMKLYIAKKFSNPDYVTKADEPNKLLRFESYKNYKGGMMTEGKYTFTCEIEFKEGRYRISFFNLRRASGVQVLSDCYDKAGKLREMNFYKKLYTNFEDLVNSEHLEIKSFVLEKPSASSGW